MINALLVGASGKMGGFAKKSADESKKVNIIAGIDKFNNGADFPIYSDFSSVNAKADVIIDFSNPVLLDGILDYAVKNNIPAVIATTGFNPEQTEKIKKTAEKIPIFFTFNMSLGVNLICSLAKKAAAILGDRFDIEIIEKHHNQKIDAPSGTAIMLANALNEVKGGNMNYEYDRHSKRAKRQNNEIGIHSVRGGTIVGEHDVIFAGNDEVVTISHEAYSKEVFAVGAIKAAEFIVSKTPGLYDMNDIIDFK